MSVLVSLSFVVAIACADPPAARLAALSDGYRGGVERAFQSHCADCHGKTPDDIPAQAREQAQRKARKAHKRLDMDDGFPFRSKWETKKLMAKIRKAMEKDDMPPRKYMKLKGRTVSDEERKAIVEWAAAAEALLRQP